MKYLIQNIFVLSLLLASVNSLGRNPTTLAPSRDEGRLESGECLKEGESIKSSNKCFFLIMQTDGNVVLYRKSDSRPLWSTSTHHTFTSKFCLSEHGSLAAYSDSGNRKWHGTDDVHPLGTYAVLQDDGNLVLYDRDGDTLWTSDSASRC